MKIFLFFLSGIILFYLFPYFPFTTGVLFIGLSWASVKNGVGGQGVSLRNNIKRRSFPQSQGLSGSGNSSPAERSRANRNNTLLPLLFFPLIFLLGFAYALFRSVPPADTSALSGREVVVECTVEGPSRELSSGRSVNEAWIVAAVDPGGNPRPLLRGRELNIISEEGLPHPMSYVIAVKIGKDRERRNPGTIKDDALYATLQEVRQGEPVKGNAIYQWIQESRKRLNDCFKSTFKGDAGALLASQITGQRSTMSEEIKEAFNVTGLAHLLSISGTHFGLFSALAFGFFRIVLRSLPHRILQRFTLYITPSQAAAVFAAPFMSFYLFLSGASVPAVRSFLMINIFLLGLLIGRKGFWLNSLLFAAFVICAGDPSAVMSISFQLSFLAVFCIGLFLVEGQERLKNQGFIRRVVALLKGSILLSLSASLGTAVLVAYYFHYFSIISPIANFFITPFIGFLLVPVGLVSSFIFILSGFYPLPELTVFLSDAALSGVRFFASLPFADVKIPAFPPIVVVIFYAGLILYHLSGKRIVSLAPCLFSLVLCLLFLMPGRDSLAVTYLDVGQGDSAVITGHGKTMVIDSGRTGRELEGYLRYLGKRRIDIMAITHADDDHAAGALTVMKKFAVKEVWDNGLISYPDAFLKDIQHRSLERGDRADAGGLTVQVLHPYRGFHTLEESDATAENNDSLVMKVMGERSFLFTGDAAEEAEEDMLHLGGFLRSDVLKVSHHGSMTSSAGDFLDAVAPAMAVISVGKDNPYGHPHRETLERLRGVRVFRTDRDGAVKITETGDGLSVKTYRDFTFERTRTPLGEWRNIKRLFAKW